MISVKAYTAPTKKCSYCGKDIFIRRDKQTQKPLILEEGEFCEGEYKTLVFHQCENYRNRHQSVNVDAK